MSQKITLAEIARRAGVNASTVSRVLHARKGSTISSEVQQKIMKICNELNYRPNLAARSTATGKKYCIGCILGAIQNDLSSPVLANIIKGICCELQEHNYTLSILWAEKSMDSTDMQVRKFLMSDIADCYIIGPALIGSEIEKSIHEMDKPIIYMAENSMYIPEGISGVRLNTIPACKKLLVNIPHEWYGRILYTGIHHASVKIAGIKKAMQQLGMDESIIKFELFDAKEIGFSFDRWAASEFAKENIERLKQQKLIWCASDLTALGIADVLQQNGVEIGKDISLIGYDNISNLVSYRETPYLTTIDPKQFELGILTAKVALDMIAGKPKPEIASIDADVIFRKSFTEIN